MTAHLHETGTGTGTGEDGVNTLQAWRTGIDTLRNLRENNQGHALRPFWRSFDQQMLPPNCSKGKHLPGSSVRPSNTSREKLLEQHINATWDAVKTALPLERARAPRDLALHGRALVLARRILQPDCGRLDALEEVGPTEQGLKYYQI